MQDAIIRQRAQDVRFQADVNDAIISAKEHTMCVFRRMRQDKISLSLSKGKRRCLVVSKVL